MSIEYEIEGDDVVLLLETDGDTTFLRVWDKWDNDRGLKGQFKAAQMRRLRRFLESRYPASEDPAHDPDPWQRF